jgi:7-cyano-7-deazaguanine synthase
MSNPTIQPLSFGQAVVCLSGGLDSTSLLVHLLARGVQVHGLSFDYGQRHRVELDCLERNLAYFEQSGYFVTHELLVLSRLAGLVKSALTDPHRAMPEGYYEQATMRATVVPNRNAIFASIAYGYALSLAQSSGQPTALALGVHSGDHAIYPDCRAEFYDALAHALALGNWDSHLVTWYLPFLEFDKAAILRDADQSIARLGLDFDRVFANTSTSYLPDAAGRPHGLTGSDVERILAFHEFGRPDPLEYPNPWPRMVDQAVELRRRHESRVDDV